jgi:peptidoglycan DL-endopeptidase CwlO
VAVDPATAEHYRALAYQDAQDAGFPPNVYVAQIDEESHFDPHALSPAGAEGIAQDMPATAAGLGIDPWNPEQALAANARLMATYLGQFGSVELALAAYNAGPGAVQRYGGIPPFEETQRYVRDIMAAAGGQAAAVPPAGAAVAGAAPPAAGRPSSDVLVGVGVVLAALWLADVI